MYVCTYITGRTLAFHIVHYASFFYWYFVAIITGLGKKSIVFSWPPLHTYNYLCTVVIMNQRPGNAPLRMDPGKTNDPMSSRRNLTSRTLKDIIDRWFSNGAVVLLTIASPFIAFRYSCLAWPWAFKIVYTTLKSRLKGSWGHGVL